MSTLWQPYMERVEIKRMYVGRRHHLRVPLTSGIRRTNKFGRKVLGRDLRKGNFTEEKGRAAEEYKEAISTVMNRSDLNLDIHVYHGNR